MDAQSPPKRMTRARSAAKTSELAAKSARVVTPAARAKTARSAATTTATTRATLKRKSPSDDDEDGHEMQPAKKITIAAADKPTRGRGRPRKVVVEQPAAEPTPEPAPAPAPAPPTTVRARGRPKKAAEPSAEKPAKATRVTRTRKTADESTSAAAEPVKKVSRGRPASSTGTATVTTTAKPVAKSAVKKTVKFEEPEKENVAPTSTAARKASTKTSAQGPSTTTTTAAAATTSGLRGKPVRKAASATATRSGRKTKAAPDTESGENVEKPMPLSPKKVNQLTMNCVESDDELGMDEKIPVRPFKKLPIKPTTRSAKPTTVHAPVSAGENDENAIEVKQAETEVNLLLASPAKRLPPTPWKGSIQSPARRVEGLVPASAQKTEGKAPQVPSKTGLLQSPAKRQPLNLNPHGTDSSSGSGITPIKLSFLSTPAKRPPISPIKPLPRTIEEEEPTDRSPAPKPTLLASPSPQEVSEGLEERPSTTEDKSADNETLHESPTTLDFPGRLSAVLPRDADPTLTPPASTASAATAQAQAEEDQAETKEDVQEHDGTEDQGEPMVVDQPSAEHPAADSASTTPPTSPKNINPMFGLRAKDLDPYGNLADSDSDDDDDSPVRQSRYTSAFSALPATPCPGSANSSKVWQSSSRSIAKKTPKNGGLDFTPLAQQLSGWTAGPTPLRIGSPAGLATDSPTADHTPKAVSAPAEAPQNTFFEDEMHVRPETMDAEEDAATEVGDDDDDAVLEDLSFTEEDMELAAEANEMSLMEKEQGDHGSQDHDDSNSEASQEYGDENAIPIDPTLASSGNGLSGSAVPPVTPQRTIRRREVHTVAKVPLKPADESTPQPRQENRCYSVSRLPAARPTERLTRNATAPSCSPCKGGEVDPLDDRSVDGRADPSLPVTPQKADIWSTMGTPARTPRGDLNPALLQGAVVFVDVHTSEGADASGIFVELLTQMGARCVKTWSWNPNNSSESGADSRVGITHVVYKDGGKRTLEKVRESGGLVQCVGVSWVLDCERENQWLDESPYYVDTSLVPRGGARRRKSMEPRSIAKLNGMLVPQPVRSSRGSQTAPNTPANNRRASTLWVRSPEKYSDEDDDDHDGSDSGDDNDDKGGGEHTEWGALTPVPKTPAPEAIARFVANISPGSATPSSVGSVDSEDPLGHGDEHDRKEALLRTCPPKRTAFVELGESILSKEKDERILMRLMAARRKSLQFAPKIGSPLSKSWKAWN
ncbi:hypothetical protein MYCTH_2294400 [Thermothelomyces thermophilus ATCC 42464]|uniref:BRCT domain-containing protein n=1 Tax=Thermothelomyces thermophilus (strain ATCC 42464 / BCRC 31852 / DSM 1799) TaxID=573729 RepID=G2Q192_THET4|nr:uncharacterized protein MYCTH_2294400 [Thermothelomyces thermophilus ATCC 42464]AEO53284.1 hypothetical protein MYCTH_2294400 [Thermothelomyces thermophilus ATCC 42464]